jgi:hypothetical protein
MLDGGRCELREFCRNFSSNSPTRFISIATCSSRVAMRASFAATCAFRSAMRASFAATCASSSAIRSSRQSLPLHPIPHFSADGNGLEIMERDGGLARPHPTATRSPERLHLCELGLTDEIRVKEGN